ncbi:cobaltochelatase CobT-related protein [Oleomonas cavernae]|uniref:cobaltochelatase CobT-related protein n=1 Tax=Oleomonas cavernae TaxID=2320859 RepID=UPI0013147D77|nr:CobT protein [Oleomonas cavernae]
MLGFTTLSWRGGKSRARWLWTRRPSQPGRLCDLLHIIHRSSDTQLHFGSSFRLMLRPNLLKENVDGEAIEWAVDRLRACPKTRKILVVISDGAPVDDSTLASNDLEILDRHLRQTVSTVEASTDIKIAALGISFDVSRYYATCTTIRTPEDLGTAMIGLLEQVLVEPNIRAPMTETAEQLST